jgi:DNA-binding response OmpR family regulator
MVSETKGSCSITHRSTNKFWNYDFGPDSKNLTVYMGYLRRKTEEQGEPRLLHTVRGVGYIAREDDGISHGDTSQR